MINVDAIPPYLKNLLAVMFPVRPKPGYMYVVQTQESETMADRLKVTISLPPASAPDVTSRELKTVVGTADPVVSNPPLGELLHVIHTEEGINCHLELVDIDNASNRSEPSVLDFTAQDTIAPAAPGQMGVVSVEEDFDPVV